MKTYPTINKNLRKDIYIYAFDKLDGNNIRAEWNKKKGFYKFGSRHQLIDENTAILGKSIQILKDKYEEDLSRIFVDKKWKSVICFFEFHGPNSFAGRHADGDELTVTLFDANPYKEGIMMPTEFIETFKHVDTPKILFEGHITKEFIDKVKDSSLKGMTAEGVVCKGKNDTKARIPIMFKIKSNAWMNKLMEYCKGDLTLFNKLA